MNGLNVDPGGYLAWMARSKIGHPFGQGSLGVCFGYSFRISRLLPVANTFGLKVGFEAMARTASVLGSITMTAPALAFSPNDRAALIPLSRLSSARSEERRVGKEC